MIPRRDFLKTQVALGATLATSGWMCRVMAEPAAGAVAGRLRLFFPPERIAIFRARLTGDPALPARWAAFLRHTDELAKTPLITQAEAEAGPGAYAFSAAGRQLEDLAFTLGLAWQVTGDQRYARRLREALLQSVTHERWNGMEFLRRPVPWHSSLWTAAFTVGCAAGCDALEGWLGAADRERITAGLVRLGVEPLLGDWVLPEKRIHARDSMGHNWWSVCVAGAGVGALALLADDPRAAGWVREVEAALEGFFDYRGMVLQNKPANFDPAGGFYEGVGYTNYAVREYLVFRLAQINALPARPPARIPLLERTADFLAHSTYPSSVTDLTVNFGDSRLAASSAQTMRLLAIQGFAPELARWYLARPERPQRPGRDHEDPLSLLYLEESAAPARNILPLSVIYPTIGWAMLRTSWENDATMLAVKCGDTWNHAHADATSFLLFHAGQPLLIDSGACSYGHPAYRNYYRHSRAHNVVLFNGQGQPEEDFHPRGVKFPGRLHNLLDGLGLKYLYADATGPMARYLTRNYRHWLWLDGVILVFDDLLAHEPGTFDWLLHYAGEARHRGGDIKLTNGAAQARVTMLFPPDPRVHEDQGLAEYQPETPVTYLALSTTEPAREQKFIVAIVPGPAAPRLPDEGGPPDSAAPLPTVELLREPLALGVRVRRGDQITDVYLNLQADGRQMHRNSNNTIAGWETDAYLFALTRPAASAAATPENITRCFVSAASYLRKDGQTVLDSLSKMEAAFQPGETMEMLLQGQPRVEARVFSPRRPAALSVNGKPSPFDHQPKERTIRFRHAS